MIKDLINAIAEGDTLEIDRTFNSVMAHKISERLDSMRVDVAQSMFNSQMVEEGVATQQMRDRDSLNRAFKKGDENAAKQGAKKEVKEYQTGPDGKQYLKSIRYESVQDTIED